MHLHKLSEKESEVLAENKTDFIMVRDILIEAFIEYEGIVLEVMKGNMYCFTPLLV